jgi:hypothetical protein
VSRFLAITGLILLSAPMALAQQMTVQQPVVNTFGGATTVSVPDRGSTFLGGVNSARSGRITTGPIRSGTAMGLERTGTSMSAHVYIHDLQAMDEAILAQGRSSADDDIAPYAARLTARRQIGTEPAIAKSATPVDRTAQAARSEQLARDAEANGKPAVARLHWQMAAKHGSLTATSKLAERSVRSRN